MVTDCEGREGAGRLHCCYVSFKLVKFESLLLFFLLHGSLYLNRASLLCTIYCGPPNLDMQYSLIREGKVTVKRTKVAGGVVPVVERWGDSCRSGSRLRIYITRDTGLAAPLPRPPFAAI